MTKTAPHAFGVDDIALTLVSVPNPVPSAGHFNRALLGTFSRAPKKNPIIVPNPWFASMRSLLRYTLI